MNTRLNVELAQRHITEGHRGLCSYCPIALAVSDAFKAAQNVPPLRVRAFVNFAMAYLKVVTHDGEFFLESKLPHEATEFVHQFDSQNSVAPFSFSLTMVQSRESLFR